MVIAMFVACGGVAVVAWLLARAAVEDDHVSESWRDSFSRDRRGDD
jgi:hypothetical protein